MPETINHSETRLFVDDTILFRKINNTKDSDLLQQDLSALERWENEWQMSFNPTKCTVIRVSPTVCETKYCGTIDQSLCYIDLTVH
jgi:hypothetical protein